MSTESPYKSRGRICSRTSLATIGGNRQCLIIDRILLFWNLSRSEIFLCLQISAAYITCGLTRCFESGRFQVFMVIQLVFDVKSNRFCARYECTCIGVYRRQTDCRHLRVYQHQFGWEPLTTVLHFRHDDSIYLQTEFNLTWRSAAFLPVTRTNVLSANLKLFVCVGKRPLM